MPIKFLQNKQYVVISHQQTKGDLIAHYLNSLSGNMIIGYELETEAKEKIPAKTFLNPEEEIYSCVFNAMKNNEKNPAKPIYFMNLKEKDRGFIGANFSFIKILDSYVNPLEGEIFIPHLDELQYSSKEDTEALKRTLSSPQLTYVTECRKN